MKKGWEVKRLEEVCVFINGLWKGKKEPFTEAGVIRNTNFAHDGKLDDANIAILAVETRQLEKRTLKYGDIILEKSGGGPKQPVGRVILFDLKDGLYSFSNFTTAIRVKSNTALKAKFLLKQLLWIYKSGRTEKIQSHSTGIRNLNGKAYKALDIVIPPLLEQERIVAILEEAFAGIDAAKKQAEQNLKNAREVFESHLDAVFSQRGESWEERRLGSFVNCKNGLNFSRNSDGQTIRIVGVGDFKGHSVVPLEELQNVRVDGSVSDHYLVNQNDILIVRSNGSKHLVGRSMLVPALEDINISFSGFIIRIRIENPDILPIFLLWFLKASKTRSILTNEGGGANISNINQGKLAKLCLSFPSLQVQKKLTDRLDALSFETQSLSSIYTRKIALLEELKKSLLDKAFKGEL